jgi:hypothetical protein
VVIWAPCMQQFLRLAVENQTGPECLKGLKPEGARRKRRTGLSGAIVSGTGVAGGEIPEGGQSFRLRCPSHSPDDQSATTVFGTCRSDMTAKN